MRWNCGCLTLCTEGVPIVQSSQSVGGHSDDTKRMASSAKSNKAKSSLEAPNVENVLPPALNLEFMSVANRIREREQNWYNSDIANLLYLKEF